MEERLAAAIELARDLAPELDTILLTVYPDAETLDTLRPGESDVEAANEIARAVAEVMAEEGVEVFVQRADRGAFRRWFGPQEDRLRWIDRGRVLRGEAAWRALGLEAPEDEPPERFPAAPGPTADALLAAWHERESGEAAALIEALVAAGRGDILDLAQRKIEANQSAENAAELRAAMLAGAEAAAIGASGWAALVALPVALAPGAVPDAVALADGLIASGGLAPTEALRFLPGWRAPGDIAALSPLALRRVLHDLVADREPADLPPGDTDDLARHGFGVLVGLSIDWDLPIWDVIEAAGGLPEEEEPGGDERALDRWRAAVAGESQCVPLDLVPLSETSAAIAEFLEEAGGQLGGLEEIRAAIDLARQEAGGEELVCRAAAVDGRLELTFATAGGRVLDTLGIPPERLPASAEGMLGLLGAYVRLV